MEKKIIFIGYNNNIGSDKLRVTQIISSIGSNNVTSVMQCYDKMHMTDKNFYDNLKNYKNSLFIWCWKIDLEIVKKVHTSNIHVYDIVDNYLFDKDKIIFMLNQNIIQGIIVNSLYMKKFFKKNTQFIGKIFVIYHHYDPIFTTSKLINQEVLKFGFMGSLPSLMHTENCLYYKQLSKEFNIEFLNTEDSKYYTNEIKNNSNIIYPSTITDLNNLIINFNCHLSIRPINKNTSKFKTTAKLATASFFNHNIITTYEEAVKDILPNDYPFILYDDTIDSVKNMFYKVIKDFNSDKELWNKGLEIMKSVKEKLNIENIKKDYIEMIEKSFKLNTRI